MVNVGDRAPADAGFDVDGQPFTVGQYEGRVLVLAFFRVRA